MMYSILLRPLLFRMDAEKVHHLIVIFLRRITAIPGFPFLLKAIYSYQHKELETEFLGLHFKNPVGLAAGFDKDANIYSEFSYFGFGSVEIGTVTPKAQAGNAKPRIFRIPQNKALIYRMGFNNKGVDAAVARLQWREAGLVLGGNIGKNTQTPNDQAVLDYTYCFDKLYNSVDYIVVNVSCPNVTNLEKLQDRDSLSAILTSLCSSRLKQAGYKPILLKLSPDLNPKQLDDSVDICKEFGIDGFVISNTTVTRNNLTIGSDEIEHMGKGGLSGAPIKDRSTELIRYVYEKTGGTMPIIGVGGIMSVNDAIEKIEAGATLIQIYTGFIYNGPGFVKKLNKAILQYRRKHN